MKIIIDPRSSYSYGSFYFLALEKLAGKENVTFEIDPFRGLGDMERCMRFVIEEREGRYRKFFLHLNDSYRINEKDYNWCDVYGSVNANFNYYSREKYLKLVSLVPSFGVRYETTLFRAMFNAIRILFKTWRYVLNKQEWNKKTKRNECRKVDNIKHFFSRRYKAWKNRLPLSSYDNHIPSQEDYIFFLSTLWYSDEWNKNDETVNLRRAHYIRSCKSICNVRFEGGLVGDQFSSKGLFSDVVALHVDPFPIWLEKTKRSALVFNTPAFWNCHGWKLGEYLALGKCIISTPLSNDLPYPLEHGVNIHFVEDSEPQIREAVDYILSHPDYRHKLERGARAYWKQWGTPMASLKLLGIE